MSSKNALRRAAHWVCYFTGASTFQAKRRAAMRVIKFHGVDGHDYPGEVFAAQLRYLKKHFSIVPLGSILNKAGDQSRTMCNDIALTFDDGLRNHFTIVYPILKRLDIPATFFVCPGLIESGQWLWNQEVRERLRALHPGRRAALCRALQAPDCEVEKTISWMKMLSTGARRSAQDAIRGATSGFQAGQRQRDQYDVMSWNELCSLDPGLVTIGSHTISHPILTTLGDEELSYEIRESRRWLEDKLNRPIEHFCYPNGAFNESVVDCVRRCYRSAVSSMPGGVGEGADLHRLKRINTARELPLFAWRLHRSAGRQEITRPSKPS